MTGGTGALGRHLARELIAHENDVRLILLVRADSDAAARERVQAHGSIPEHTEVMAGNLSKERFGLSDQAYQDLCERVTHIMHAAASTRFNSPLEEARKSNVATTERMLAFAKECSHLKRFGYLSTAMVAGKRIGRIMEDDIEHDDGFVNTYQESKYEAEALVRASGLPVVIFRPPFVYFPEDVHEKGSQTSFLSLLVRLVVGGQLPFIPGTTESEMDIVSGPETVKAIGDLFLKDHLKYVTYQIANGTSGLTVGAFHKMMEEEKGAPILVEYCGVGDAGMQLVREKASADPRLEEIYRRAESFLSEPAYPKVFDNAHTLEELGLPHLSEDPFAILREAVHAAL